MAQYPSTPALFSTKLTGETVEASHVNDLQAEVTAITEALLQGLAHNLIPATTNTRDLGLTGLRFRNLWLSGNATVAGTVTAASFAGDGSALTGITGGVSDLDDLGDVVLTTPVNGEVLLYNGSEWVNDSLPGGSVALDDLIDVDAAAPVAGDLLQWDGVNWVPASISGFETGDVKFSFLTSAPTGWVKAQGQAVDRVGDYAALFALFSTTYGAGNGTTTFNLPNLARKVPLGAAASAGQSTVGETGGTFDHTHSAPVHSHGTGTLAVASHNHGVGTLAVDAHAHGVGTLAGGSHTHGPGTLATASHGHPFSTTSDAGGDHTHSTPAHTHGLQTNVETDYPGGGGGSLEHVTSSTTDSDGSGTTGSGGSHTHTLSGNTDSQSSIAVSTGVTAAQTVSITGSTASATPTISGNTGSVAPSLSGSTANSAAADTGSANQQYIVLNAFIKM